MKGISPLISIVILVAFTIAIATIITGSLTTTVKTQTDVATKSANCPGAALDIISVNCNIYNASSPGRTFPADTNSYLLNVTLTNAGRLHLENFTATVFFNDRPFIAPLNLTVYSSSARLDSGATALFVFTVNGLANTLPTDTNIQKLRVTVGNCPGLSVELTNESKSIGRCQ